MSLTDHFHFGTSQVITWHIVGLIAGPILAASILLATLRIIYNLFFHPLRKFPGPRSWIAFPALEAIASARGVREFQVCKFHEHYGDVVRTGVDQLTFITTSAWKDIYGHGHAELPKWHPEGFGLDGNPSIVNANSADHFRFRRAMLPAFSDKALGEQESLIQFYVDLLMKRLSEVALSNKLTNMVKWYTFTTFDLIGDLAFGESFDGLESGQSNDWIENIAQIMKLLSILPLITIFPWLQRALLWLMANKIKESQTTHANKVKALTLKRINNREKRHRGDFMDFILRSRGEKHELTNNELASNSDTIIIAGSETTATLLSGITYYLLADSEKLKKCVDEVRTAYKQEDEISFRSATANLPYLLACLNEALRVFPPIPLALPRVTLPGQMTPVSGRQIPPKVQVGVNQLAAYHNSHNFHRPRDFCPERWLPDAQSNPSSPFYHDNRDVHKPFSFGPRDCIGRNLAFHEMRLIMARILWRFDLKLRNECARWGEEQKIYSLWEKTPLMVEITQRTDLAAT